MQHKILKEHLGPQGDAMVKAVEACVHCGFCLPTCPTYVTMGEEMDSPRGRIILMKEVMEGNLDAELARPYIDHCLGCVSCVTACPSGVEYGDLLTPFRALSEKESKRGLIERLRRLVLMRILPYPQRFRVAVFFGIIFRPFKHLFPAQLRAGLELLPGKLSDSTALSNFYPAMGKRRARVALLAGCAQQVIGPNINLATIGVLNRNGVDVLVPSKQACCGALAMHIGEEKQARAVARKNLSAFPTDIDAIVTNAAGCGSGMHEYGLLFKGKAEEPEAISLSKKTIDVSSFLHSLGFSPPENSIEPTRVVYHDACHLAHAQKERIAPRELLSGIPNLTLLEPPEWELCCGSAGTYNIDQPDLANQLGERKARNLLSTQPEAIVTGNIGCMTQIRKHLNLLGQDMPVYHTMELLDAAYRNIASP